MRHRSAWCSIPNYPWCGRVGGVLLSMAAARLLGAAEAPVGADGFELEVKHMFVTSASGPGDLSQWDDAKAVGAHGLAAGDAICRAEAASLDPGHQDSYRAWLSTKDTDAYCHMFDVDGFKRLDCGFDSPPIAAGPWQRPDGERFAAGISHLFYPYFQVYTPPRLDENGSIVHGRAWTGSIDGELPDGGFGDCRGWTSSDPGDTAPYGDTDATAGAWEMTGLDDCSAHHRLYCFEIGVGAALPPVAGWGRLAFLTHLDGRGDLGNATDWIDTDPGGGLAAGDAICRASARRAGLPQPDSFKAWLSTGAVTAKGHIQYDGPWMRLDRVRIANDLSDLTDGTLHAPLNVTEHVFPGVGQEYTTGGVWTGTRSDGLTGSPRCEEWTNGTANRTGLVGAAASADANWTSTATLSCNFALGIYCLQDIDLLFSDGFESASFAVWDGVSP